MKFNCKGEEIKQSRNLRRKLCQERKFLNPGENLCRAQTPRLSHLSLYLLPRLEQILGASVCQILSWALGRGWCKENCSPLGESSKKPRGVTRQKQVNKDSAGTWERLYVRDICGDGIGRKEDPQKWGQSQMDGKAYREI